MAAFANRPLGPDIDAPDDCPLTWTIWPARQRPVTVASALIVVLMTAVFIVTVTQWIWAGVFGALFLIYALRLFFFPTIYHIDADGITVRDLVHKAYLPWRRVRRFEHEEDGATLSTRASSGFFDEWFELNLVWNENRVEAVRLIEHFRSRSGDQIGAQK